MSNLAFRISEPGKDAYEVEIVAGLSVGRVDENDVSITDSKMSGRHAHVIEDGGVYYIEDLGSSNKTHVLGGDSLGGGERYALKPGVALQLGESKFVVVAGKSAPAEGGGGDRTVIAQVATVGGDGEDGSMGALAEMAAFKTAKPRLVIVNEAFRRIDAIEKVVVTIGREGEAPNCVIDHPAVSNTHAQITFSKRRFYLEDIGSANGTHLNGQPLTTGAKAEVTPESHIRFGSVDALFVVDCDSEGKKMEPRRHRAAMDLLQAEGKITKLQRNKAMTDAESKGAHAGEMLLESGYVRVADWVDAMRRGELVSVGGGPASTGGGLNKMLILVVVLLGALVAILIIKPSLLGL